MAYFVSEIYVILCVPTTFNSLVSFRSWGL